MRAVSPPKIRKVRPPPATLPQSKPHLMPGDFFFAFFGFFAGDVMWSYFDLSTVEPVAETATGLGDCGEGVFGSGSLSASSQKSSSTLGATGAAGFGAATTFGFATV